MKNVYKQTANGWILVRKCKSFQHACAVARELEAETGIPHCVNS